MQHIIICYTKPAGRGDTLYEVRGNVIVEAHPTLITRYNLQPVKEIPNQKLSPHLRSNSGEGIPVRASNRVARMGRGKTTVHIFQNREEEKGIPLRFPWFFNKAMAWSAAWSIVSRGSGGSVRFLTGREGSDFYPPEVFGEAWYSDSFIEPQNTALAKWSGYAVCEGVRPYKKKPAHKPTQKLL